MLKAAIRDALDSAAEFGWVLEPDAKSLLRAAGLKVPAFKVCREANEAVSWAREIGYPVAAKVVSPKAMHKSEVKGVVVGISDDEALGEAYDRFRRIDGFYRHAGGDHGLRCRGDRRCQEGLSVRNDHSPGHRRNSCGNLPGYRHPYGALDRKGRAGHGRQFEGPGVAGRLPGIGSSEYGGLGGYDAGFFRPGHGLGRAF